MDAEETLVSILQRFDPRLRLAAAIGWSGFAIILLAALVGANLAAKKAEHRARADAERLLTQFATQIRHALDMGLETRRSILQATAAQIAASGDRGTDALRHHIETVQAQFPEFTWLGVADEHGRVVRAGIHTYGDTVHVFVERKDYRGVFLPGYRKWESDYNPPSMGFRYIDHMVGNVELGKMNECADFYGRVLGFSNIITFDDKDISTEYSALMSKVMSNGNGRIKFPINEPAPGKKKSQIEEYLDFYKGPGCQHIAIATNDIVHSVQAMRQHGVEFLYVPGTYYDTVSDRVGIIDGGLLVAEGAPGELVRRMGADVITLEGPGVVDSLPAQLEAQEYVSQVTLHAGEGGYRLQVGVDSGETRLPAVIGLAAAQGVHVQRVSTNKPSLGDVFLAVTGYALRDVGGGEVTW